ncbi:retron St85 family RNA-directed DNA polymerase [Providencia manganoxydans]|uniref:retron St85 family RNA-directed DNA polymerase n=1 Tax=Providencia manganoxydans TaxID=2923283 RepID=UPI0029413192|nr:retron St85 family RNA-directed DNA polymerase [Providencia stuartii]ELR5082147.1 retron St85 family RNA-directed DNA polymerase [Providencia stuartii]
MQIINQLAKSLNLSELDVELYLQNAPSKYKVYKIRKRTTGFRLIAQPTKKLKEFQRAFIALSPFPIHESAIAYRRGKNIRENASAHAKNAYLLKIDFENFFNSITPEVFWCCFEHHAPLDFTFSAKDRLLIEKLLFWQPQKYNPQHLVLSVGAPSSPTISNFCLYEFDKQLSELCYKLDICYTRYADDLTFSTNTKDVLKQLPILLQEQLNALFDGALRINQSKTVFSSKAHNRHVTGVTINNENQLSLGRERKRFIKHLIHQYKYNLLEQADINYLRGLLAFANHIEPKFIVSMNKKYTKELINRIRRGHHDQTT